MLTTPRPARSHGPRVAPQRKAALTRSPVRTGAAGNPTRTGARDTRASRGGAHSAPRPGGLYVLVGIVVVLNLVGLVMVLSASSILSLHQYGSPWHYFERQVLWLTLASVVFFVVSKIDPARWRHFARPAMVLSVIGLTAVLVPGIGRSAGGASRWIGTASLRVQPSEIAKLTLVLFAADVLDRRGGQRNWRYSMVPVIAALLAVSVLVLKQPDMGTTLVLACIVVAMLITAGIPARPLAGIFGAGIGAALLLAIAAPYRWRRVTSFLHPLADKGNSGYQAVQGLAGLSHGSILGTGIGASIATWGYLPNAQTDFIFAVIGEETGLLGTFAVTSLFAALAVVGIRVACRARTRYEAMLVAGVTAWIVSQAVINIGAVIGILPVTGVPLPFVSFGGSSLVLAMFAVAMVANVARRS
ncbi:MAG: putative lipid II flippase FtsW [Actinomycetota bacterium]|nr:putative lipid II flippase FtsW [Actinomycetota bacterium]